jgi:hypothetical protein
VVSTCHDVLLRVSRRKNPTGYLEPIRGTYSPQFASAGRVFVESVPNETAHAFLRAFIFVMLIDVGVKIYREVSRIRMPDLPAPRVSA